MSIDTRTADARRVTAARLLGTAGVLGATVAIAGLGTFGAFTDSTTPVETAVDTGVVSIAVSAAGQATVPYAPGGLVPGDSHRMLLDLHNDGTVPLSSVTLTGTARSSSALDADPVHGLQVRLESCSDSWDAVGGGYACAGEVTEFYAGPILLDQALDGAASLEAGGVDHLLATVSFPESAGNALQGQSSRLEFTFTGTQRTGTAR